MQPIQFQEAPNTNAHYSPALQVGNIVYLSGQLPLDSATRKTCGETVREQAAKVLENIETLLLQAGGDRFRIAKTTAYIPDIAFWEEVNRAYKDFFGQHLPARSIVVVKEIHFGCLIEIDGIAVLDSAAGTDK